MTLFDNKPEEIVEETPVEEVSVEEKFFELGDNKYTQEELESLVNLGKFAKEVEEKQNIKLDRVYPEFTKKSQAIKDYEDKIRILEEQQKNNVPSLNPDDENALKEAKEAARRIGLVLQEDLPQQAVTRDDFRKMYMAERQAEKLLDTAKGLEKTYSGEDGRPKFDTESMLDYMEQVGIEDPEIAYKVRYEKELDAWKESKINEVKKKPSATLQPTQKKEYEQPKFTKDNIRGAISEALGGN